jgi:hypothetical protein
MRKEERVGREEDLMGRTEPSSWRVMLGCVSEKGAAVTLAMSMGALEVGSEAVNSNGGEVNVKSEGTGSTTDASATRLS